MQIDFAFFFVAHYFFKELQRNVMRCPFHPRVTTVARKRPRSSCPKYRWQVTPKHAYTLDPTKSEWADYAAVQAKNGNLSGNELTRNLTGNIRPQSSQLAEPLWTDPDKKSEISVRELKKKEEKSAGLQKFSRAGKKPRYHSLKPCSNWNRVTSHSVCIQNANSTCREPTTLSETGQGGSRDRKRGWGVY